MIEYFVVGMVVLIVVACIVQFYCELTETNKQRDERLQKDYDQMKGVD